MDQLFPRFVEGVDPFAVYAGDRRQAPPGRPWIMLNMVVSADGAGSVQGRSGGLSGPGDRRAFAAVREAADVIVVGAATVRAEGYGPGRYSAEAAERRRSRGQAPAPRIAVISGSLDLDFSSELFRAADRERPWVFTAAGCPAERLEQAQQCAEVHICDGPKVLVSEIVSALAGVGVVLVEGGAQVNGQFLQAGLLDELCLTLSPVLVGGDASRMVRSAASGVHRLQLDRVLVEEDELILRYLFER